MGTTAQKLQRILETKTGFKDLITEKGGVITETTTFHEYIDEARKLIEGGKVVVEEASATAVPNSGVVENIYFNTSLTPEEVDKIITEANLEWFEGTAQTSGSPSMNIYFVSNLTSPEYPSSLPILIMDYASMQPIPDGSAAYAIMVAGEVPVYISPSITEDSTGWIQEGFNLLERNGIVIHGEANSTCNLGGVTNNMDAPVGLQNEALKQIISITPFDDEPFKKELSGTYEPVTVEVTENSEIDLTTYMDEQKMPIKVNVEVPDEPVIVEESAATAVPNQGYVENIYFNTNLSTEEVDNILNTTGIEWADLSPMFTAPVYALISNGSNKVVLLQKYGDKDKYVINDAASMMTLYVSPSLTIEDIGEEIPFTGWNQDFDGMIDINSDVYAELSNTPVGLQNEALKQLISITPFDGESFRKELTGTYEAVTTDITENGEVDLTTYWDNGEMPIKINVNVEESGDSGVPLQPATEEEMNNLLVNENIGKVFLYTGETNENFTNGEYYIIEEVTE